MRSQRRIVVSLLALVGLLIVAGTSIALVGTRSRSTTLASISKIVLPHDPTVYFFGDSWTEGYSAAPSHGYAYVVGRALGWHVVLAPDGSGTGYVHAYAVGKPLYPERAASIKRIKASLIILQGSVNDIPGPLGPTFSAAVEHTIASLRRASHNAPIVMVGPAPADGVAGEGLNGINFQETAIAKQEGIPYISPIDENWINTSNVSWIIDTKTGHPDTQGHAYFGARVAEALEQLTTTSKTTASN